MRTFSARLLLLCAVLSAGSAQAGRWDLRQQLAERKAERRPLFQRRPVEPDAPRQQNPVIERQNLQEPPGGPAAPPAEPMRPRTLPADAARRAQQQYGGRVLSVTPADSGYRVRLLRDGEVNVVTVPD